jgi:broad specificity phosphatase PhoE
MRLYLVRHAEPAYPEDARTPRGREEAKALAARFARAGLDGVASSPLRRAVETAEPTAAALGLEPAIEPWAREIEEWWIPGGPYGEQPVWQVEPERLRALDPGRPWYRQPPFDLPLLESEHVRLVAAADEFLARSAGVARLALFCHEGVALTLLAHLLGLPAPGVWGGFRLPPASVTTVEIEGGEARCLGLGDIGHWAG